MGKTLFDKINLEGCGEIGCYHKVEKKLTPRDLQCLKALKEIVDTYPAMGERELKKILWEIIKKEHYQLLYYDGHTSEETAQIYEIIQKVTKVNPEAFEFNFIVFEIIGWATEYFASMNRKIEM